MTVLDGIALLVTLAAAFSFINYRYIRLPSSIGLMLIALVMSLGIILLGSAGIHLEDEARQVLGLIDFNQALMTGMLSFLLFAGALHIDLAQLSQQRFAVGFLAVLGVVVSTTVVGVGLYYLLHLLGQPVPLSYCLVFGALISPTDPIAVLSIIRKLGTPKSLEMKIAGESLFNDGVGVVVFVELLAIAMGERVFDGHEVLLFFVREALGGVAFGLALGYGAFRLLCKVDDYEVEVLITVALVMGGYALAQALHLSGPIAIVVAGLLIGNQGRRLAMSAHTREHLDSFWALVDSMLNAVLFVLIGLEVLLLPFDARYFWASVLVIPLVLLGRLASVALARLVPGLRRDFTVHVIAVLTWGGLRGGISVALALSLPAGEVRPVVILLTYTVVVFSILVQGLTISKLVRRKA